MSGSAASGVVLSEPAVVLNSARLGGDTSRSVVADVLCVRPLKVEVLAGTTEPGFANTADVEGKRSATTLLNFPQRIMQPDANTLLIADRANGVVRKYDITTNSISTWAGVVGFDYHVDDCDSEKPVGRLLAKLIAPSSVCADPEVPNGVIIASDDHQKVLRRVDEFGQTRIVAGSIDEHEPDASDDHAMAEWVKKCLESTTTGLKATFSDIACVLPAKLKGSHETLVYMTCMSSNCVRSYNPRTGEVKLVVGNGLRGSHTEGSLEDPFGLAVDSQGRLIISCLEGYTILRYDPTIEEPRRQIECIAGRSGTRWFRDGLGTTDSLLGDAAGVSIDPFDTIYFCDYAHGAVRAISPEGYVYTLVCADEHYTEVSFEFSAPFGIHFDRFAHEAGKPCLYVIDFHRLIRIDLDPATFPTPDQPTAGRRHNLLSNPNAHTLDEEIVIIEKTKEMGVEVQALENSIPQSAAVKPPKAMSRGGARSTGSNRGVAVKVATVQHIASKSSARDQPEVAPLPLLPSGGEPVNQRTSNCSVM